MAHGAPAAGLKPCPDLAQRAGVWRFKANRIGQKFPADGERVATGIRDISALDWSAADGHLYGIMHGRDSTNKMFPNLVSAEDDNNIADEMHRITKDTNFGWPYTYYDGARKLRLIAPEYGGDGKTAAPAGIYATPIVTFQSPRAAPVDLLFYSGDKFPAEYRGGAFVVLHGTRNKNGYDIAFVPSIGQGSLEIPKFSRTGSEALIRPARHQVRRNIGRSAKWWEPMAPFTSATRRRAASGGSPTGSEVTWEFPHCFCGKMRGVRSDQSWANRTDQVMRCSKENGAH